MMAMAMSRSAERFDDRRPETARLNELSPRTAANKLICWK